MSKDQKMSSGNSSNVINLKRGGLNLEDCDDDEKLEGSRGSAIRKSYNN